MRERERESKGEVITVGWFGYIEILLTEKIWKCVDFS